jgi:hypothetical protein
MRREIEIGRILHLKSEIIRNPKFPNGPAAGHTVQSEISDFGFELQDLSNFNFFFTLLPIVLKGVSWSSTRV